MADNGLSDALETALNHDSFDVLEFVTGDLTPRKKVSIYTNSEAGYRLNELLEQEEENVRLASESDGLSITDEGIFVDEDEVADLRALVEASALTFHLKGLAPKAREAIQKELQAKHGFKDDSEDVVREAYFTEFQNTLVAKSIERAANAQGAADASWSASKVAVLRERVNAIEVGRLDEAVFDINTDADLYSRAVNADFLSKR